jgi:hypothetical protein
MLSSEGTLLWSLNPETGNTNYFKLVAVIYYIQGKSKRTKVQTNCEVLLLRQAFLLRQEKPDRTPTGTAAWSPLPSRPGFSFAFSFLVDYSL